MKEESKEFKIVCVQINPKFKSVNYNMKQAENLLEKLVLSLVLK